MTLSFRRIALCLSLAFVCSCSRQRPASEARATSDYVDARVCAGCHPAQAKTYRDTGMGRSFSRAVPAKMTEALPASFYHKASDRYYDILRRGDRYFMRRHQKGPEGTETNVFEAEIHYVVGSGNHSRSYISRTAENRLIQLPVSWYAENGGSFAMSPGYDHPEHFDFRRKVNYDCLFCHNGYPRPAATTPDVVYPADLPEGIDCQRCHGPGAAHVQAATQQRPAAELRSKIVNPKRLETGRQMEVCMQCHLETTTFPLPNALHRYGREPYSYRPGEPLSDFILHFDHGAGREDKFEIAGAAYRLRQSACFLKSAGKLQCTTCHNPHQIPRGDAAATHYTSVCRSCHQTLDARRHPQQTGCVDCHMPKRRTEDVVHVVMTDHKIVRRKPAGNSIAPRAERRETAGKSYQGEVTLYYPATLPARDRDLYVGVAQVIQQSNLKDGIARLERAIETHQPGRPEFYFDLAEAQLAAGNTEAALALYQSALQKDPRFAPALRGLGSAHLKAGEFSRSIEMLEQARAIDATDAPTLHELARAYYQTGRLPDAISTLQAALRSDPDWPEIHDSLGNMLLESGKPAEAEASLREAIRRQPDFASAYGNLGNALMTQGKSDAAITIYRQGIAMAPSSAVVRYSYGAALASKGQFAEAESQMRMAVKINRDFAEAQEILGNLHARRNDWPGAIPCYQQAIRVRPEFARAHLGLAMAFAATRNFAAARTHLQRAAAAPDPAVRQEANEMLQALAAER